MDKTEARLATLWEAADDPFSSQPPEDSIWSQVSLALTHLGGEVARLRGEMDYLQGHHAQLLLVVSRLREVIAQRDMFDLEDFDLACEVLSSPSWEDGASPPSRGFSH